MEPNTKKSTNLHHHSLILEANPLLLEGDLLKKFLLLLEGSLKAAKAKRNKKQSFGLMKMMSLGWSKTRETKWSTLLSLRLPSSQRPHNLKINK